MAVGKNSIKRVKAATGNTMEESVKAVAETKKNIAASKTETEKKEVKKTPAPKTEADKKAPAKKPVVLKKDNIHEKKFEAIGGIYTELPTYLL